LVENLTGPKNPENHRFPKEAISIFAITRDTIFFRLSLH
ncbi:hypothetical protein AT3G13276, partial [Arabidopsis thaliana]